MLTRRAFIKGAIVTATLIVTPLEGIAQAFKGKAQYDTATSVRRHNERVLKRMRERIEIIEHRFIYGDSNKGTYTLAGLYNPDA